MQECGGQTQRALWELQALAPVLMRPNKEAEAAKAYDNAALVFFGEHARLNFPNLSRAIHFERGEN